MFAVNWVNCLNFGNLVPITYGFPKIGVGPKMDGENNGTPLLKWMIWEENPLFSETSI